DLTGLESGQLTIHPSNQAVDALLDDAAELQSPQARERSQMLRVLPFGGDVQVVCDRGRVLQVLANLIGNAVKYSPEGATSMGSASVERPMVRFPVEDTGPGISPELVPKLFERYWRADGAAAGGRGLGLFISKGIVQAMDGTIAVDTHPGR